MIGTPEVYAIRDATFRTPNGNAVTMAFREGTSDWNTLTSCLTEDEYGLRGRRLSGHCLDIGAHIGGVTLALLADFPDLVVTAVEPVAENVALLRRNVRDNGYAGRARIIHGLAGRDGRGTIRWRFEGSENARHHAFIGNSTIARPVERHVEQEVSSYSLSTLIGRATIALAKVDCEGGEYAFLADPAVAQVECFVGEWHPARPEGGTGTRDDIVDLLGPTHRITFSGPSEGPGGFLAERR